MIDNTAFGAYDLNQSQDMSDELADTDADTYANGTVDEAGVETEQPQSAPVSAQRTGISRAQARRIAAKAISLDQASVDERALAARMLGLSADADPAHMAAVIFTSPAHTPIEVADARAIAEADPMEAGILAGSLERSRMRAVWTLLNALGVPGTSKALPNSDAKAALSLAKKILSLEADVWESIDNALALARK